ncbi:SMP-30/gluconolactonase/LRE family protein [Mucilaginibacter sp. P25]|uniref:SMP-30/gluconolactonase/LRE family protein n=1 Tax=Mucilaginibacter sp. P25 TaxID=3423945 RepID=UPI003D7AC715
MKKVSTFILLISALSVKVFAQTDANLYDPNTKPQLVAKQFSFTEGPAVDKKGNVFFTDQPNNKIWKYDTNGKLSVFLDSAGRSNGMYFDKKGISLVVPMPMISFGLSALKERLLFC